MKRANHFSRLAGSHKLLHASPINQQEHDRTAGTNGVLSLADLQCTVESLILRDQILST